MATQVRNKADAIKLPAPHRWTRRQYDQMIEAGIFGEDDRVELINGEIIEMSPQGSRHYTFIGLLAEVLEEAYAEGFLIRTQGPLVLDPDSEPEPDVAVVRGRRMDYFDHHPITALLVIEVSDSSLAKDRTSKEELYARHQISEYWILNVEGESLEVYRNPVGETYQTKTTLHRGDSITPPKATNAIAVADVLP